MAKFARFTCLLICFLLTFCKHKTDPEPLKHSSFSATAAVNIGVNQAVLNGVLSVGIEAIVDAGFVWGVAHNPTIGGGMEKHYGALNFDQQLTTMATLLSSNTIYYFRTFLTLSSGTVYSDELSFTTLVMGEFKTQSASGITFTTAILNGTLSVGGSTIQDCGYVWATTANPIIGAASEKHYGALDHDQSIAEPITALQSNMTYYFRTFVITPSGTVYGDQLSFKTLEASSFATMIATSVSFTEAIVNGVLSKHDDAIFDCGFVWSISHGPTTSNADKIYYGSVDASGSFLHKLNGLTVNATYYFRTFLITSSGISYGDELSFTTLPEITWDVPGGFPGQARMGAISFVIGGNAYVGLGHGHDANDHTVFFDDFYALDLITNTWTQRKSFPGGGRSGAIGMAIGDKGYAGTGTSSNGGTQDFWMYDPVTDEWIQKADFGGGPIAWAAGFSIDDKGYVGTGCQNANGAFLNIFYAYDPAMDVWTQKADFPGLAVDQAVGFNIGDYGYIGMGLRTESWLGHTKQLWAYLPASNTWTQKTDCPSPNPLYASIAFTMNNKAYVGLGWDTDTSIWAYDPQNDNWSADGQVQGSDRVEAVAFTAGTKAFIGTGSESTFFKDFVEYEPQ
jgi:N-acetylneuraminic acid mutarotase